MLLPVVDQSVVESLPVLVLTPGRRSHCLAVLRNSRLVTGLVLAACLRCLGGEPVLIHLSGGDGIPPGIGDRIFLAIVFRRVARVCRRAIVRVSYRDSLIAGLAHKRVALGDRWSRIILTPAFVELPGPDRTIGAKSGDSSE